MTLQKSIPPAPLPRKKWTVPKITIKNNMATDSFAISVKHPLNSQYVPTAEPLSLMVGEIFSLCIGPLTRTNYLEEIKLVLIFFNLFLVACAAVGVAFVLFRQRILFRIQEAVHLTSNLWLELMIIVSCRIPKWFDCKSCAIYGTSKHDKSSLIYRFRPA